VPAGESEPRVTSCLSPPAVACCSSLSPFGFPPPNGSADLNQLGLPIPDFCLPLLSALVLLALGDGLDSSSVVAGAGAGAGVPDLPLDVAESVVVEVVVVGSVSKWTCQYGLCLWQVVGRY